MLKKKSLLVSFKGGNMNIHSTTDDKSSFGQASFKGG
jgi:hypothetical protein